MARPFVLILISGFIMLYSVSSAGASTFDCNTCFECNQFISNGSASSGDMIRLASDLYNATHCIFFAGYGQPDH